jgi:hypothetical protein
MSRYYSGSVTFASLGAEDAIIVECSAGDDEL